ncbi:oligosaccharide flippase family protein [Paenibacillus sp. GCM10023252]|uniref:putative polysaccharide biosynthesis protein n=1 Tax=Paenibacillus sp. GCM10023252 TaxID=3252649 RepID=UPI003612EC59
MIKKDSLLKGTLILAAAALVARFLGLFQRIPMDYMLGEDGGISFSLANNLYLWLLVIATGGIPSAISKMVSERHALGRAGEAQRIYRAALVFGAVTGLLLSVILYVLAPWYSSYVAKIDIASSSIRAIAPALLLFPIIAMMRGYFQGRQMMSAGGISQIIEQVMRVIVGIGLALFVLNWGWGDRWVAAAVSFGSVFGSIGALAVMLYYGHKLSRQDAAEVKAGSIRFEKSTIPFRKIYGEIFSMSIPIVVTAMTVNLMYLFDTSLFMRLTEGFYTSDAVAKLFNDAYSVKAIALAGIPPILAIALSQSIIPAISAAHSVGNVKEVQRQASLVMRIVVFTGVPIALLLTVAATSATGFLFPNTTGSGLVAALTAGTIFQITMMTSNSILFGLGKARLPMRHTLLGFAIKVAGSLALAPLMGAYGLIAASTLCFLAISWLNLRAIRRGVALNVLGTRWPAYLLTIAVASAAGFGTDYGLRSLLSAWPDKLTYLIAGGLTALVVGALYVGLLIVLRVITPQDIQSFPGPLRKLFGKVMRLIPGGSRQASS